MTQNADPLVRSKVVQAIQILEEQRIDCWLTVVRETRVNSDPVLPLIYGHELTWQSVLALFRTGEAVAIVGHYEGRSAENVGAYEVRTYHQSLRDELRALLAAHDPQQIALNYSEHELAADGLTVGMYRLLLDYLEGTPYPARVCSSERLVAALRGRKSAEEVRRIRAAIHETEAIYAETFEWVQPGVSEHEIGETMHGLVRARGLATAWDPLECPMVNAGPDSPIGHLSPTTLRVQRGQLLHFDFGVSLDEYHSDIQRVMYLLAEGETAPPPTVQRGFDTVRAAVQAVVAAMRPGILGHELDAIARRIVTEAGYPEFMYATGHQVGRAVHDGGGILGPPWERYGDRPFQPLEAGQVYAVEPGLMVPGYGYIGIEEDVRVTDSAAEYLTTPQQALVIK